MLTTDRTLHFAPEEIACYKRVGLDLGKVHSIDQFVQASEAGPC